MQIDTTIKSGLPIQITAYFDRTLDEVVIDEINWRSGKALPAHMVKAITPAEWTALQEDADEAHYQGTGY